MKSQQNALPDEIICQILSYANPLDVIRVRQASKRFHAITGDRKLWEDLYASACLPRPCGPFPHQPTSYLERVLVQSARVALSWTNKDIGEASYSRLSFEEPRKGPIEFIYGKWVVTCESSNKIVLYSINQTTSFKFRKVIWKDEGLISEWFSCSISSTEGERVYIVISGLHDRRMPLLQRNMKLLEFRVDLNESDSNPLEFLSATDLPVRDHMISMRFINGMTPFLHIGGLQWHLIFDTRTRTIYEFPKFSCRLGGMDLLLNEPHPWSQVFLSSTHILSFIAGRLIQAFTLPQAVDPLPLCNGLSELRLTHEYVFHGSMYATTLLRDSIVDPLSGSTNIRFLKPTCQVKQINFHCMDLTLPKPQEGHVLPISVNVHSIFTITPPFPFSSQVPVHVAASKDGYARGFCRVSWNITDTSSIFKFAIDASQDKCVAELGRLTSSLSRWRHLRYLQPFQIRLPLFSFDFIRGRMSCVVGKDSQTIVRDHPMAQAGCVVEIE